MQKTLTDDIKGVQMALSISRNKLGLYVVLLSCTLNEEA